MKFFADVREGHVIRSLFWTEQLKHIIRESCLNSFTMQRVTSLLVFSKKLFATVRTRDMTSLTKGCYVQSVSFLNIIIS